MQKKKANVKQTVVKHARLARLHMNAYKFLVRVLRPELDYPEDPAELLRQEGLSFVAATSDRVLFAAK